MGPVARVARSRTANATADSRNSTPVTASQCHRYGAGDSVVDAWYAPVRRRISGNQTSSSSPDSAAGTRT